MEADAHIRGYFIVSPRSKAPEYLDEYAKKFFACVKIVSLLVNLVLARTST